jgi:hypothetical protein
MAITTLNTAPIFTGVPEINLVQIPQASTNVHSSGGTAQIGTNIYVAFTSGANGSYVQKMRFQYTSTTNTVSAALTVFKVYFSTVNTGIPSITQASLIADIQSPAQTISAVTTSAYPIEVPLNFAMPANTYLLVGQTAAATANGAWNVTTFGGDY